VLHFSTLLVKSMIRYAGRVSFDQSIRDWVFYSAHQRGLQSKSAEIYFPVISVGGLPEFLPKSLSEFFLR